MTTLIDPMAAVKVLRDAATIAQEAMQDAWTYVKDTGVDLTYHKSGMTLRDALAATANVEAPTSEPATLTAKQRATIEHAAYKIASAGYEGICGDLLDILKSLAVPQALPATEQAKENVIRQAQQWALEAKTQRATVLSILRHFGLPENDWEALRLIQAAQASPAKPDLSGLIATIKEMRPPNTLIRFSDLYVEGFVTARDQAAALLATQPVAQAKPDAEGGFDFHAHLARQAAFSLKTFGPGPRTVGVLDHIRKELIEIEADPLDLGEWVDVVILALDGAWRCGGSPDQIIDGIVAKQTKNEGRNWPDWRTADPTKAIEHDRSGEVFPVTDATSKPAGTAERERPSLNPEPSIYDASQHRGPLARRP
jgi:hypothetical protein